ncbi:hypothetical protein BDFB_008960 [Asbolus verrucosus]|uniref:Uncharacterized protein n=1 Tax=Asbolus verrucosus TaxID=1661398 RepID=A0A482V651_ASBVE|nr:hypothetical protein BDFB_008960 [Asbolus verrucosus]
MHNKCSSYGYGLPCNVLLCFARQTVTSGRWELFYQQSLFFFWCKFRCLHYAMTSKADGGWWCIAKYFGPNVGSP